MKHLEMTSENILEIPEFENFEKIISNMINRTYEIRLFDRVHIKQIIRSGWINGRKNPAERIVVDVLIITLVTGMTRLNQTTPD